MALLMHIKFGATPHPYRITPKDRQKKEGTMNVERAVNTIKVQVMRRACEFTSQGHPPTRLPRNTILST